MAVDDEQGNNMLDDVWGSDGDEVVPDLTQDLRKLRDNHSKRGYLDGIVSAKDENLQTGFNASFPLGSELGMRVGKIIGRLQGLEYRYGGDDTQLTEDFVKAKQELRIDKILTKSIFDPEYNLPEGKHPTVDKWEELTNTYCKKYNVTTK
ncbi:Protein YAE1 [Nakaseomyces bracarensis]|uniref:Protein YAE1 n=1 Tax=Nakaseomyces bracarensis TaxID=273131 RepID=A0ABR4NQH8_9SACH